MAAAALRNAPRIADTAARVVARNPPKMDLQKSEKLPERNRRLYEESKTRLKYGHGHYLLRLSLCYAVNGQPIISNSTTSNRLMPKEAMEERHWQLCVNFKIHQFSSPSPAPEFGAGVPSNSLLTLPVAHLPVLIQRLPALYRQAMEENSKKSEKWHQRTVVQRLPGTLFGVYKKAYFLTLWRPSPKFSSPSATDGGSKQLLFLSQHCLEPNEYHAWLPFVHSIPFTMDCLPDLYQCLINLLRHPEVHQWAQNQHHNQQNKISSRDSPATLTSPRHLLAFLHSQLHTLGTRRRNTNPEFARHFIGIV